MMTVILFVFYNGISIYSNIWLSEWSSDLPIYRNGTNGTIFKEVDIPKRNMRLLVYGALGLLQGNCIQVACKLEVSWFVLSGIPRQSQFVSHKWPVCLVCFVLWRIAISFVGKKLNKSLKKKLNKYRKWGFARLQNINLNPSAKWC